MGTTLFSAHAGQTNLVQWGKSVMGTSGEAKIFLTHGENMQRQKLAEILDVSLKTRARLPSLLETAEI
jgi:predicted metal-dependent RNase